MKKDKDENPYYSPSIQKALNKLISEEWLAGQMYMLLAAGVKDEDSSIVTRLFTEIAEDELSHHFCTLVNIAKTFGYTIPSSYCEFRKYANEKDVRAFESFKSQMSATKCLELAQQSEERAISSYREVIEDKHMKKCIEFFMTVEDIYFDETKHLDDINFALDMTKAGIYDVEKSK